MDNLKTLNLEYFLVEYEVKNIPSDGNFESKNVWYKLNNEGTVYMRFPYDISNNQIIKQNDNISITYSGVPAYEMLIYNEWWKNPKVKKSNREPFIFEGLTPDLVSIYGEALLLPLNYGIRTGADIDVITVSNLGTPDISQYGDVFIYAAQYFINQ